MPSYSTYLNAIAGKTFGGQYTYLAVGNPASSTYTSGGMVQHEGYATTFAAAPSIAGTVTTVDANTGTFQMNGVNYEIYGASENGGALFFRPVGGGQLYLFNNAGTPPTAATTYGTFFNYTTPNPLCFAEGTRLLTVAGERTIESLVPGDLLVGENGALHAVRWIGRRRVKLADNPWARHLAPVLIERGAMAANVPARDLVVSPGHGIALGEWLVEAEHLVNGSTIRFVERDAVDYLHVELDQHAIIHAEGLTVESFVDVGNRADFDNYDGPALDETGIAAALAGYCRPVAHDRETIAALRAPIEARAAERASVA